MKMIIYDSFSITVFRNERTDTWVLQDHQMSNVCEYKDGKAILNAIVEDYESNDGEYYQCDSDLLEEITANLEKDDFETLIEPMVNKILNTYNLLGSGYGNEFGPDYAIFILRAPSGTELEVELDEVEFYEYEEEMYVYSSIVEAIEEYLSLNGNQQVDNYINGNTYYLEEMVDVIGHVLEDVEYLTKVAKKIKREVL